MREIICTVKRSHGSKRRPRVMTAIGRTHPTSGTRHMTAAPPHSENVTTGIKNAIYSLRS